MKYRRFYSKLIGLIPNVFEMKTPLFHKNVFHSKIPNVPSVGGVQRVNLSDQNVPPNICKIPSYSQRLYILFSVDFSNNF